MEGFLRSLGVPRDSTGILNFKSHSRKEERVVHSNKKDQCSGLPSTFAPSEALNLNFTRQKDFAQILCSKNEKCQFICDSFKDESDNSCDRNTTVSRSGVHLPWAALARPPSTSTCSLRVP